MAAHPGDGDRQRMRQASRGGHRGGRLHRQLQNHQPSDDPDRREPAALPSCSPTCSTPGGRRSTSSPPRTTCGCPPGPLRDRGGGRTSIRRGRDRLPQRPYGGRDRHRPEPAEEQEPHLPARRHGDRAGRRLTSGTCRRRNDPEAQAEPASRRTTRLEEAWETLRRNSGAPTSNPEHADHGPRLAWSGNSDLMSDLKVWASFGQPRLQEG